MLFAYVNLYEISCFNLTKTSGKIVLENDFVVGKFKSSPERIFLKWIFSNSFTAEFDEIKYFIKSSVCSVITNLKKKFFFYSIIGKLVSVRLEL